MYLSYPVKIKMDYLERNGKAAFIEFTEVLTKNQISTVFSASEIPVVTTWPLKLYHNVSFISELFSC